MAATTTLRSRWANEDHIHTNINSTWRIFILHMPPRFFARVFGNPAGDPVLLKSRGVTLLRDNYEHDQSFAHPKYACTAGYFFPRVF